MANGNRVLVEADFLVHQKHDLEGIFNGAP